MEVADMLDVLHFLYEEDLGYSSIEDARWTDAKRKHIYSELYGEEYKYYSTREIADYDGTSPDGEAIKPYIPPTEFNPDSMNPFGEVLDAPIG